MNGHLAIENSLRYSNAQTNLQSLKVGELSKACRDRSIYIIASEITVQ